MDDWARQGWMRYMAVYQFGGLAPFYFRGDPEDFINAGNLVDAMMDARRAFRHATWRGDFGAALAAEMQADAASAELTVLFGELLTEHMEPIDGGTIRDAIAGLRCESDEESAHDQAAARSDHGHAEQRRGHQTFCRTLQCCPARPRRSEPAMRQRSPFGG